MDIVITTIFPPTEGARKLASGLQDAGKGNFWVIGDRKGPFNYDLPATRFFPISEQSGLDLELAALLNEGSYARKNLGYLLAIRAGAECIVETDDDNIPLPEFWETRNSRPLARPVKRAGWFNAYRAFSHAKVWPRGFPLEFLQNSWGDHDAVDPTPTPGSAFVQQGLANENPDVDAVFRLICDLPLDFHDEMPIRLEAGCWSPFNSQNTTFFSPAFPLLYLPTHCSFRMTDIWRSFIAQRCLWAMGSSLVFTKATVFQRRNEHLLLRDFKDEVSGYLHNEEIRCILEGLILEPGTNFISVSQNLIICYKALIQKGIFPDVELGLLNAWLSDLGHLVS